MSARYTSVTTSGWYRRSLCAFRSAWSRGRRSDGIVFQRDIPVGVVLEHGSRDQAEQRTKQDIAGDGVARSELREQRCRDQRGGTAGDHGGQLVAQGSAAVAQPPGERLRDQRGLPKFGDMPAVPGGTTRSMV